MSKARFLFILAVFVVGFASLPSWADTDYPCLDTCIKAGKAAQACLPQCTSNSKAAEKTGTTAETDYQCLNICTRNGKPGAACLSQCSYAKPVPSNSAFNITPPPDMAEGAFASSHDVLHAPVPAGDTILIAPKTVRANTPDKDYACIQQCLHDGMQYDMCNQNCAAVTPGFKANQ